MTPHPQIRLLAPEVANKIAAGEVVERPASVVKELMENALDAGTRRIEVSIVAGGARLVGVTDDGWGMDRDNALMAIERHATSKIRDVADIERIATLGFRGEALAAIASVSRFRMQTCLRSAESGTEITISGGKIQDVRDIGCPPGTSIEIRDLFFNVPARRKFMRSPATELMHVRQMFLVHALAHPDIAMRLVVDGREAWQLVGGATQEDRVRDLFGPAYLQGMRPVDWRGKDFAFRGLIGLPAMARADTTEQFVFINGRPASAPVLHRVIREACHGVLAGDRHPALLLFIDIDPCLVDVNVHPTKREVRFRNPGDVRDGLMVALQSAWGNRERISPGIFQDKKEAPSASASRQEHFQPIVAAPPSRAFQFPRLPMIPHATTTPPTPAPFTVLPGEQMATPGITKPELETSVPDSTPGKEEKTDAGHSPWSWCRIIGQIGGLYVLLETEDGFVIMDPHAAHERVLFEQLMNQVRKGSVNTQGLLMPDTVELAPRDAHWVRRNSEVLKRIGFGIAEFGGDTFVVDAVPTLLTGINLRVFLADTAQAMEEVGARGSREKVREDAIAQAACKAAVKAHDRLSPAEIEKLVMDLAATEMPYTCPHGRPTLIYTSFHDLRKKFGRA